MKDSNKLFVVLLILVLSLSTALFIGCDKKEAAVPEEAAAEAPVDANVVEDATLAFFAEMPAHKRMISQDDFVAKVAAGEEMTILDLRRADDYAKGHVAGAVNVPWGSALYEKLVNIPQEGEVYIYCYSGQTANQAVILLNIAGVPARSVKFGWNLGISRVDGVDAVTETDENTLDTAKKWDIDPAVFAAYKAYYDDFGRTKGTPFANNIVSEENAKAILDAGDEDVVFVSIRKAEDYAKGHIEGASNLPWGSGMNDLFASLPADKKIIIYCYTGQTAGQTVAGLRLLGYDAVSLKGGMGKEANSPSGWGNKGLPVVQ